MIKEVSHLTTSMSSLCGVEMAKVKVKIEAVIKDAYDVEKKSILQIIVGHYKHFDDLVFSMAEAAKQDISEINLMNVVQFYSLKRYLQEKAQKIKEKTSSIGTDEH